MIRLEHSVLLKDTKYRKQRFFHTDKKKIKKPFVDFTISSSFQLKSLLFFFLSQQKLRTDSDITAAHSRAEGVFGVEKTWAEFYILVFLRLSMEQYKFMLLFQKYIPKMHKKSFMFSIKEDNLKWFHFFFSFTSSSSNPWWGNFLLVQSPSELIKTHEPRHPFGIPLFFPFQGCDWFSKRDDGYISHKTRPLINCLLSLTGAAKKMRTTRNYSLH